MSRTSCGLTTTLTQVFIMSEEVQLLRPLHSMFRVRPSRWNYQTGEEQWLIVRPRSLNISPVPQGIVTLGSIKWSMPLRSELRQRVPLRTRSLPRS
jgi:hypothetical protein